MVKANILFLFACILNRFRAGAILHPESETFKCKSGELIVNSTICNGVPDCADKPDEAEDLCWAVDCPENSFRCAYGGCVDNLGKCNGSVECVDGSDEDPLLCHTSRRTPSRIIMNITVNIRYEVVYDEFQCTSGQYISIDNVCDGIVDCQDGSDETRGVCVKINCPGYAFQCSYGACIDKNHVCNGKLDCADGSDENTILCNKGFASIPPLAWSAASNCILEKFQCNSGQHISEYDVCDGKAECTDKTDEIHATCSNLQCPPYAFRCRYGACISANAKCNGTEECVDGSDEDYVLCGTKLPTSQWIWSD